MQWIAVVEIHGALFCETCVRLYAKGHQFWIGDGAHRITLDLRHLNAVDSAYATLLQGQAGLCAKGCRDLMLSYLEPDRRLAPTVE